MGQFGVMRLVGEFGATRRDRWAGGARRVEGGRLGGERRLSGGRRQGAARRPQEEQEGAEASLGLAPVMGARSH